MSADGAEEPAAIGFVERISQGDRVAEDELYASFRPTILAVLRRRLHRTEDAEDVLQDVFEIVLPRMRSGGLRYPELVGGFLYRVTLNCARNHNRKRRPEAGEGFSRDPDDLAAPERDPAHPRLLAEHRQRVLALLARLPENQREVLEREFLHDQERRVIAEALGVSPQAVSNLRHRGLRQLLEMVRQEGDGERGPSQHDGGSGR